MSNLLKKASIITTPTAYDDGRILSVKPSENLYGPELVTNGDFSNGTTGWSSPDYNSTLSIVNGQMKIVSTLSLGRVSQAITTEVGKKYLISATTTNIDSSTGTQIKVSNAANLDGATYSSEFNATTNPLTITHRFIATATTTYIGSSQGSSVGQSALLDNVSVVEDLSGDFDFSRGSAATRVNAQGLVENVQILSSELAQNGNFSEIGSEEVSNGNFSQEGSELVTNGDFNNGSTGWAGDDATLDVSNNTGKVVVISNSVAGIKTNGVNSFIQGKQYKLTFDIVSATGGLVSGTIKEYSNSNIVGSWNGIGSYTIYFTYQSSSSQLRWLSSSSVGDILEIDNVSVKEVGQNWTFGTGWNMGDSKATVTNSSTSSIYQDVLNTSKSYKVTFEITEITSGGLRIGIGQNFSDYFTQVGTYTYYGQSSLDTLLRINPSSGTNASIDNVSVKEVGQDWGFTSIKLIGANTFKNTGTNGKLQQSYASIVGAKYRLSFTINSGNWNVVASTVNNTAGIIEQTGTTSNSGTIEFIAATTTTYILLYNIGASGTEASITNISLLQVTDDTDLPRINYEGFSYQDVLGSELITNGDFAVDGSWVKGTGWTISGGSANGSSTTSDLYQENVVVAGKKYKVTYTISNYVSGSVRVELPNNSSAGTERSANGTYTETILSGGTLVLFDARTSFTGSIDNVSVKEITGQEVVPNSGCGSWLFEPQSTNLITYSIELTNSSWVKTGVGTGSAPSVTSNYSISPDGTQNADRVIFNLNGGSANADVSQVSASLGSVSSASYTNSVYIKSNTANDYDLVITKPSGGHITKTITTKWQRFDTPDTNVTNISFRIRLRGDESTSNYADVSIWGAQLEQQSYATSYIPTDGAASTRLQDIANNSGNSTLINSTEGVLYAEIAALANDLTNRYITLSDGTSNNRLIIRYSNGANNLLNVQFRAGGVVQANLSKTLSNITVSSKVAFKYKQNDFALWVNGVEAETDTSGSVLSANTLNKLNFSDAGGGVPFFGKNKAIVVFKEALTDAELQALTTI